VAPCNGIVHAVDKATGQVRWTYDARPDFEGPGFHGDVLVTEDLIILGSDGPRRPGAVGYVYALERTTGKPRWKHRVGGGVTSDVIRDGPSVFAVTLEDELICLDVATGRLNWSFPSGSRNPERLGGLMTPALQGNRILFGGHDGVVYAIASRSGKLLWKRDVGSPIWSPVLNRDGALFVGTRDLRVRRLDPVTGATQAQLDVGGLPFGPLVPAGESLLLLVGSAERGETLKGLDPSLQRVRWSRDPSSGQWTSSRPYLWRDSVLAGSDQGELAALSPRDGSIRGSDTLGGTIRGIGSDGEVLYVGTLEGKLYAYVPGNLGAAKE
jgi:outer membrane protein assembly factor BamB